MIDRSETDWYRDAIIYQVHVKSFFDSNNDGIGDFVGLTQQLDYIRDLGVTAIWIMPFYPSPLRDDGYDIADYRAINASYGSMRDFRRLVRECHDRGLRVITELVINHTSDQHKWFQRARKARAGSRYRDYYVWSDTDQNFKDARIIFLDTEASNWAWDPVAQSYYWHRFYSHQPDLNFDNPRVLEEVIDVMRYWLDIGVDGMRLDAIPYLIEREGTNCENLDETHTIIKKIRAAVDADYSDRMLLAEANQWPEDTADYFGDGDECHMAFHFPLMPRMYMAIAQEDRYPITDIMRQTPETPDGTQWAIFLRNHDELTLEMVTDRERDYLWDIYAADRRSRINLGIRRRLAPLLGNDRRKIELMNSLLLSMPGTPVLYYGDEIGMGDNIYLGDRDGVRTPMQWSPDRNGGFSRADPAKLFLPAIMDPIYGYEAVNVEAQSRNPSSLLNWVRRMVSIRRQYRAFGRGSLRFLYPGNRKVLAYMREWEDEKILCVANLSRSPQAVELQLSEYRDTIPVEMQGGAAFPPVGDLPYMLTLPGYGFYWFVLSREEAMPPWHVVLPEPAPDMTTLVIGRNLSSPLSGREREEFVRNIVPQFLGRQRWFAGKSEGISRVEVLDYATLPDGRGNPAFLLPRIEARLEGGEAQTYFMPLAASWEDEPDDEHVLQPYALAKVRQANRVGLLVDAAATSEFPLIMTQAVLEGTELRSDRGTIRFHATSLLDADLVEAAQEARRLGSDQSNTSIVVGDTMVLKLFRRLTPGIHPEVEMGRFLSEVAGYRNVPTLLGYAEHEDGQGERSVLAVLQGFVRSQGDGWTFTLELLGRELERLGLLPSDEMPSIEEAFPVHLRYAATMGRRIAELHHALTTPTEDAMLAAEETRPEDLARWAERARAQGGAAMAALEKAAQSSEDDEVREKMEALQGRSSEIDKALAGMAKLKIDALKTRVHGDLHLGQILIAEDDICILDFEGEPARPMEERREKLSPLKDVAGMVRSFAYAEAMARRDLLRRAPEVADHIEAALEGWRDRAVAAFLGAYEEAIGDSSAWPADREARGRLLDLLTLEKALYEIVYEAENRPDWVMTPVAGTIEILDKMKERGR